MTQPRIHILLHDTILTASVSSALDLMGAEVVTQLLDEEFARGDAEFDACLVLTSCSRALVGVGFERVLIHLDQSSCAAIVLAQTLDDDGILDGLVRNRPICIAGPLSPQDLAGRLTTLCSLRKSAGSSTVELDSLASQLARQRDELDALHGEIAAAARMQRSISPGMLPRLDGADVHVLHRPAGMLGGDFHDVRRVDKSRVAICVADATGHGLDSALLCAAIRPTLITQSTVPHKLVDPSLMLQQANRELCDMELPGCEFVAAIHAVYDETTGVVRWARAGAPYPVLIRANEPARSIVSRGCALGISLESEFEVVEVELQPNDTLMFFTDGLEEVLRTDRCAEGKCVANSAWLDRAGGAAIRTRLDRLNDLVDHLDNESNSRDDVSVLTLTRHAGVTNVPRERHEPLVAVGA